MIGDACVASFQNGATTSDFTVLPYVSADMAKAGDYSGTLEFTVSIQPLDTYKYNTQGIKDAPTSNGGSVLLQLKY